MTNQEVNTGNELNRGCSVKATPLLSLNDHGRFQLAMRLSPITQIMKYNEKDRSPYQVRLNTDMDNPPVHSSRCVFKSQKANDREGKYFREAMDLAISTARRELLAYCVDLCCGFWLVPPVVWREIPGHGSGSLQAWTQAQSGSYWRHNLGYDYTRAENNPWMHRLVAFDILIGNVDRHAKNWLMDDKGRVYAIDNGYSFPKRNDCRFISSLPLKGLIGKPLSKDVKDLLNAIQVERLKKTLDDAGFRCREESGVLRRLNYLRGLQQWQPVGRVTQD